MNPVKILAAVALLVAVTDVTSGQASFNRFFSSLSKLQNQPAATCDWLGNPLKLKELQWAEYVDLCFDAQYKYPGQDVETALVNDVGAQIFLNNTLQCYSYRDQKYYNPWNQVIYTQDLCPVRHTYVDKVWRYNKIDRKQDVCYIVRPEEQRVMMAQCGAGVNHPDSQKCKRDSYSYFEGNYYCIPDGYVSRLVLAYCPWDPEVQCVPVQVKVPTGCSCKQYTCDKGRSAALAGLGSLAGRLNVGK